MINKKIGKWTVISNLIKLPGPNREKRLYECKCECGNIKLIFESNLKKGAKECRDCQLRGLIPQMMNKRFEKLTVESYSHSDKNSHFYNCICDCGNKRICNGSDLRLGKVKRCVICRISLIRGHGMKNTSIWVIWMGIKARCLNPNNRAYKNYGGRGIEICDRWHKFELFYEDMGDRPQGLQIDRINNDGPYTKENCRWVTSKENNNNRRKPRGI